ncbi:two-component response regulator [Pseudanabaena phage Pam4]|nr:two-component response regulator [Pseudanabaena phage Pam4]
MNSSHETRWVWDPTGGDDGRGDWITLPPLRTVAIRWDSHRTAAEVEDVRWLTERCGLTFADACARRGVDPETIEKRMARSCRT